MSQKNRKKTPLIANQSVKNHIYKLRDQLQTWNYEYYELGNPTVSDAIYDTAMQELISLEQIYPQFKNADSPSEKVGGQANNQYKNIFHNPPMLSLTNAHSINDLHNFAQNIAKTIKTTPDKINYLAELKIDGLSISCHYKNHHLISAATRGDGRVGENVTANVLNIKEIPAVLPANAPADCEIRGEVYLSWTAFNDLNTRQKQERKKPFANPRNAAVGALRNLNPDVTAGRNLQVFFYFLVDAQKYACLTQQDILNKLKSWGMPVNDNYQFVNNISDLEDYINKTTNSRSQYPYQIDGIVVKVNQLNYYKTLGNTAKAPRWAIAYKFPAEIKISKCIAIEPSIGRTGQINYNARLNPVQLAGTIVQNASLHNGQYVMNKDIRIGDYVYIQKAGDIIPEVIAVDLSQRSVNTKPWKPATNCFICSSLLTQKTGYVDQYCLNKNCPGRITKIIEYFCSKQAMDINGISEKIINLLITNNLISRPLDLYYLHEYTDKILALPGFSDQRWSNLKIAIEKSKSLPADRFLIALGIPEIGVKMTELLMNHFKSISNLQGSTLDELITIKGIGSKKAKNIFYFFQSSLNQAMLKEANLLGINFEFQTKTNLTKISGQKFVITGTLSKSRRIYREQIIAAGGKIMDNISKNTDYLIAGAKAGSKLTKAQTLKIKIINESELIALLS